MGGCLSLRYHKIELGYLKELLENDYFDEYKRIEVLNMVPQYASKVFKAPGHLFRSRVICAQRCPSSNKHSIREYLAECNDMIHYWDNSSDIELYLTTDQMKSVYLLQGGL